MSIVTAFGVAPLKGAGVLTTQAGQNAHGLGRATTTGGDHARIPLLGHRAALARALPAGGRRLADLRRARQRVTMLRTVRSTSRSPASVASTSDTCRASASTFASGLDSR